MNLRQHPFHILDYRLFKIFALFYFENFKLFFDNPRDFLKVLLKHDEFEQFHFLVFLGVGNIRHFIHHLILLNDRIS